MGEKAREYPRESIWSTPKTTLGGTYRPPPSVSPYDPLILGCIFLMRSYEVNYETYDMA